MTSIRIMQINCQRSSVVSSELSQLLRKNHFNFIVMQEPYYAFQEVRGFPLGLVVVRPQVEDTMVAAVCPPECNPGLLLDYTSRNILTFSVNFGRTVIYIVNVYCQYCEEIQTYLERMQDILEALKNERVMILMDSNAKSPMWHSDVRDLRGVMLEDFIATNNLYVLNEADQLNTFSSPNGESNIDVSLVTSNMRNLITSWTVMDEVSSSDHRAIVIELSHGVTEAEMGERQLYFKTDKADWETFSLLLLREQEVLYENENVSSDWLAEKLVECIRNVSSSSIPVSKPGKRHGYRWWNRDLERQKCLTRKAARRIRVLRRAGILDNRLNEAKENYRILRNRYYNNIKRAKTEDWQRFVTENGNNDPWGIVYKLVFNKISVKHALSSIKFKNLVSKTYMDSLKLLVTALLPQDEEQLHSNSQKRIVSDMKETRYQSNSNSRKFTMEELEYVIGQLKPHKAPGEDMITNEILRKVAEIIPETLLYVFNRCLEEGCFPKIWKIAVVRFLLKSEEREKTDPKSYRPICLLSVLGKLLERLMVVKIMEWKGLGLYNEKQYGFVRKRSTTDAIGEVMKFVENVQGKYVAAILFDVEGAFDSLWWPALIMRLRRLGCPMNLYDLLLDYLNDREVLVRTSDQSYRVTVTKGCPQGSVLGPVLWNITYDILLEAIGEQGTCKCVAYADDLIILESGQSRRDLENRMQKVVDIVEETANSMGIRMSIKKTEAIILRGKFGSNRTPIVKLYGNNIRFVESCRYLGVHFERNLTFLTHVKKQRSKLMAVAGKIQRVVANRWGLNRKTLTLLYKGLFVPILTYAASSWYSRVTYSGVAETLVSSQRPFLLMLTRCCRTVSSVALQVLSGVLPADLQVLRQGLMSKAKKGLPLEWQGMVLEGVDVNLEPEIKKRMISMNLDRLNRSIIKEWQDRWDNETRGRVTYGFIEKADKLVGADHLRLRYETSCFLTGHGFFRAKLTELGLSDSPECRCGHLQSSNHVLLDCELTATLRDEVLGNYRPSSNRWFLEKEENFSKFEELAGRIFTLQREEGL